MKGWNLSSPGSIIGIVVGIAIATALLVATYPMIIGNVVSLGSLGNFTFASFFQEGGVVILMIGALVVFGLFGLIGYKLTGSKR